MLTICLYCSSDQCMHLSRLTKVNFCYCLTSPCQLARQTHKCIWSGFPINLRCIFLPGSCASSDLSGISAYILWTIWKVAQTQSYSHADTFNHTMLGSASLRIFQISDGAATVYRYRCSCIVSPIDSLPFTWVFSREGSGCLWWVRELHSWNVPGLRHADIPHSNFRQPQSSIAATPSTRDWLLVIFREQWS